MTVYVCQDGSTVQLCASCGEFRASVGPYCEMDAPKSSRGVDQLEQLPAATTPRPVTASPHRGGVQAGAAGGRAHPQVLPPANTE